MEEIKVGAIFLSSVTIYYDKYINGFEVEYTRIETGEKLKCEHYGLESNIVK